MWYRTLLSTPCVFKKLDSDDSKFAEHNTIRIEIGAVAKLVVFSARQTIYNIAGFKKKKEENLPGGQEFSAAMIAEFYRDKVKNGNGQEALHKKSVVDSCITLYQRLLSIPEVSEHVKSK